MFGVDNTFLSRVVDDDVFEPYEADGPRRRARRAARARARRRGDAGRLRRRVRQLRHGLVRRARARPAGRPRRRSPTRRTATCSSSRTRRRRRPAWRSCWPRSPSSARTAGPTTGRACATTASRSSTAGQAYYERFSGAERRRPSRSSSATARARRPRSCSPTRRSTSRRRRSIETTCFRQVEFAGVLRGTDARRRGRGSWSTSCCRERFQAELPLNLFVYPANGDVALPDVFTDNATRAGRPGDARPGDDRRQPRGLDRRVDRHRPALIRRASRHRMPAGRRHVLDRPTLDWRSLGAVPVVFLGRVLRLAVRHAARPRADAGDGRATTLGRSSTWEVAWFTLWQAVASTVLTIVVGLAPAYVLARYRFPGRRLLAGLLDRGVRAADRRDGRRRPRPAARRLGARRAGDPRRPRRVQPRRRRAHRRRGVGAPAARPRGGRGDARRVAVAGVPRGHPAAAAPGDPRRGVDRVRVHVHVVRRDPRARRRRHVDDRGRDLAAGDAARRHRRRGHAGRAAARRRSAPCVAWSARAAAPPQPGARPAAARPAASTPAAAASAGSSPPSPSPTAVVVVAPLVALVERSLRAGAGYSLAAWRDLGRAEVRPGHPRRRRPARRDRSRRCARRPWRPRSPSSIGALAALAIAAARRGGRLLDTGLMLPIATSAVTIGFGMLITFDAPPVDWRASWWLVPVGQALVAVPFVVRTVLPVLRGIDPHLHDAAATLGASPVAGVAGDHRCPTCAARSSPPPGWPRRSRSASSGRPASCRAAASETMPIAIERLLGRTGARRSRPRATRWPRSSPWRRWRSSSPSTSPATGEHEPRVLDVRDVTCRLRRAPRARRRRRCTVGDGEVVALLGPSGSGKSTLLRVDRRARRARRRARSRLDGVDITDVPTHRRGVGMVFQDEQLFPHRDVAANVAFGLRMQGVGPARTSTPGSPSCSPSSGSPASSAATVTELSGGEAKRVALARSLAPAPRVLLLDEPLTGLDRELHDRLAVELGRDPARRRHDRAARHPRPRRGRDGRRPGRARSTSSAGRGSASSS